MGRGWGRLRNIVAGTLAAALVAAAPAGAEPSVGSKAAEPKSAAALITRYYESILRRAPDAGGLAFWQGQAALVESLGANANETFRALAIAFFNSPEYRAFNRSDTDYLRDLYATFFGREADPAGLAYWLGQLRAGQTRESLLLWFLFSPEFDASMRTLLGSSTARPEADMVIDFYRGFFGRLPDESGFLYWVGRLRSAQCSGAAAVTGEVEALSNAFLLSGDYANRRRLDHEFLTDMYNAFVRRGPELAGFMDWGQRVRSGLYTRDAVRRSFVASPEFQARVQAVVAEGCYTLAAASNLSAVVADQSVSPFLAVLELRGRNLSALTGVSFSVAPKAGTLSRPVAGSYSGSWLASRGYGANATGYRVPVFGLYESHANTVQVRATFTDGSIRSLGVPVATAAFSDPANVNFRPVIVKARGAGEVLGFDFFYLRTELTMPVVVDSDGEIRWWAPGADYSVSTLFERNGFSAAVGMDLVRTELDGRTTVTPIAAPYYRSHHNLDPGRTGVLVEVDDLVNGVVDWEHILVEVAPDGRTIQEWKLGDIIASHMRANGDDPAAFVRFGSDWFHMNAAWYDPRDDSVILSSRENFVIKVGYSNGDIRWIFGDPTKYWYTFPSLRAKALQMAGPGLYPVGQHSVSVTPTGRLLLFNNGEASLQSPPGAPRGENRGFSVLSAYEIDPVGFTAREVVRYDHGVRSRFCSSVYEAGGSWLVSYSRANDGARARLVGLDSFQRPVFDFDFPNPGGCNTAYSAVAIPFDAMSFP